MLQQVHPLQASSYKVPLVQGVGMQDLYEHVFAFPEWRGVLYQSRVQEGVVATLVNWGDGSRICYGAAA